MIIGFALLYIAFAAALVVGQAKILAKAFRFRQAGIGRFTYSLDERPIRFWGMLLLETAGLLIVALYLLGTLGILVR